MKDARGYDLSTVAAHGVRAAAPEALPEGQRAVPSAEPLYQTSVFDFDTIEGTLAPLQGEGGYVYARNGLPNARSLELTVCALEGGEEAVATASGMAAIACAVLACAKAGERVLLQRDAYGGTVALMAQDFARWGIRVDGVDAYDPAAVARALAEPGAAATKAILVETVSNPLVRETDVKTLAAVARAAGAALIVDNTFATPVFARPLADGADAVVHSVTKFLGGHHDLCAGVLVVAHGQRALADSARGVARRFGAVAAPFDAWLACRGIRTLAVRMERCQANAVELAARLRGVRGLAAVHYPGRGALLSFDVGTGAAAARVVRELKLITLTPSLGGTTTTLSHPATSSHRALTPAERAALGIGDGLLRLSLGLESPTDLWADLGTVLNFLVS